MTKKTRYSILTLIIALTMFLTGCGDKIESVSSVKRQINQSFPQGKIVSINEKLNHNTFIIRNQGFEFTFENIIYSDAIFGVNRARYECDYLSQVINTEDVTDYIHEHGFVINGHSGTDVLTATVVDTYYYKETLNGIERIYNEIDKFEDFIYDYLPNDRFYEDKIQIEIYIGYRLIATENITHKEHIDWDKKLNKTLWENREYIKPMEE